MWQTASERMSEAGAGDQEETIVEYVVRERLTKDQLVELLVSLGGQKQGSRDELGERLLAIRGLKPRDVLTKLATDDLKVVIRRFGVPEPSKSGGLMGFANAVLSDDRSSMVKRIDEVAIKQRTPIPRGHPQPPRSNSQPASMTGEAPAAREPAPVRAPAPASVPTNPPERTSEAVSRTPPIPSVGGTPAGLPVFQETRDFVGAYKFAYQWDSEDLYEAELLGALRGRFGSNNAIRQQGDSGRVYDIVVRNAARIEVKLPKQKTELDRMIGQVGRYLSQHPGGVIVVIIGFTMKNQQEIHNAQEDLERAGAVVFVK